ncbi:hypothetical protein QF028_005340 [Neobacillus sp. B4I6]
MDSLAIRQINIEKVSKTTYSLFLIKNGLFEIDIDENGIIKIVLMNPTRFFIIYIYYEMRIMRLWKGVHKFK